MAIPKLGPVIAIDGPAGTGKSTATRQLADRMNFVHVDTGALYRAVAFEALRQLRRELLSSQSSESSQSKEGVSSGESGDVPVGAGVLTESDLVEVDSLAMAISKEAHIEFKRLSELNPSNRIFLNGVDLTGGIRTSEVSMTASRISAIPEVRLSLLGLQRRLGCAGRAILEGRDIGTVVFPDAEVKFFLTASVEERAKRRLVEMEAAGVDSPSFEDVKNEISTRDYGDTHRKTAPLKKASDAIEIDTSSLTLDQVVEQMYTVAVRILKLESVPPEPPARGSV